MNYTIEQITKLLGTSPQAVNSLIKRNRLKASKHNRWYITSESLTEYAELRLTEITKEQNKLKTLLKSIQ